MTILEKIKFEEDWLSEVNLTKQNIEIAFAGIRATALEHQPCEDCISRETAIDQFIHWYSELLLSQKEEVSFEDILKSLPSVLPQHKKGKWIRYDVDIAFHPLHCSICGWSNHHIINKCIEEFQFCPNCGAKMEVEE